MAVKQNLPTLKFDDYLNGTGGGTHTPPKTVTPTTVPAPTYSELAGGTVQPTTGPKPVMLSGAVSGVESGTGALEAIAGAANMVGGVGVFKGGVTQSVANPTNVANAGNGGNGGSDTGNVEPKPTFEEWYEKTKTNANTNYDRNVANAQTNRDQAYIDAQNAYDQNKSEYGSNAAALSAMGLTGSGYSDYLNARAYGQMQGNVNAANRTYQQSVDTAAIARDQAIADADLKYIQYVEQKDAEQKSAYTSLYNDILTDPTKMSEADIDNLAAQWGITDEAMVSQLKAARKQGITALLDSNEYTKADLDRFLDPNSDEYQKYLAKLSDNAQHIDSFTDSEGNELSKESAGKFVTKINETLDTYIANLTKLKDDAVAAGDEAKSQEYQSLIDKYTNIKTNLATKFNETYDPIAKISTNIRFKRDNIFTDTGTEGSRVILTRDSGKERYVVEYGDKDDVPDVIAEWAKTHTSDGDLFQSKAGDFYVVVDGTVYPIDAREWRQNHWEDFREDVEF